jgi:serine/threonine protein kinase
VRPPTFDPLLADDPREIGGYRIVARLGAGGMGCVYLGVTQSGRRLAIKVVRPEFADDQEFRRRFQQEVAAAQRVQNLYTAPVIDADLMGRVPWLATAHVPGPSLAEVVHEEGPLPLGSVQILAAGVAEALQAIHKAGVIHRDLKPSNVLLAADGPRVIDFGIARAADATPLTRTGGSVGTPQFMAPEQALGKPSTPALDVFAFGSLVFFAATGRSPFGEGPSAAVLYRIVQGEPDLSGCPPQLTPLVAACLEKEPSHRPPLNEILNNLTAPTSSTAGDWLPPAVTQRLPSYEALPTTPQVAPVQQPQYYHPAPAYAAPPAPAGKSRVNRSFLLGAGLSAAVLLAAAGVVLALNESDKDETTPTIPITAQSSAGNAPTANSSTSVKEPNQNGTRKPAGSVLGQYKGIRLLDKQAISFTDTPQTPWETTKDHDGDLHNRTLLYGDKMTVIPRGTPTTYKTCAAAVQGKAYLTPAEIDRGSAICVTTNDGIVGLVTVNDIQSTPDFIDFDLTIWQGLPPR